MGRQRHPERAREATWPSRLAQGTALGRYVVDGWLRDGSAAALYRGHHVTTGVKVAIKVQRPGQEDEQTIAARFGPEPLIEVYTQTINQWQKSGLPSDQFDATIVLTEK